MIVLLQRLYCESSRDLKQFDSCTTLGTVSDGSHTWNKHYDLLKTQNLNSYLFEESSAFLEERTAERGNSCEGSLQTP